MRSSTAITYDAAGNPLAYRGGSALTWSAGRRLSSHETAAFRSEYAYNDTGIRTGKSVTDKASGAVTATEYYLSDGDIIAEERTRGGRVGDHMVRLQRLRKPGRVHL